MISFHLYRIVQACNATKTPQQPYSLSQNLLFHFHIPYHTFTDLLTVAALLFLPRMPVEIIEKLHTPFWQHHPLPSFV